MSGPCWHSVQSWVKKPSGEMFCEDCDAHIEEREGGWWYPICGAECDGYTCRLPREHAGPHDDTLGMASWPRVRCLETTVAGFQCSRERYHAGNHRIESRASKVEAELETLRARVHGPNGLTEHCKALEVFAERAFAAEEALYKLYEHLVGPRHETTEKGRVILTVAEIVRGLDVAIAYQEDRGTGLRTRVRVVEPESGVCSLFPKRDAATGRIGFIVGTCLAGIADVRFAGVPRLHDQKFQFRELELVEREESAC